MAKARAEGTRALEALIKEVNLPQRKTQTAAEEKVLEASSKMNAMANGMSSKASGQWDKLENIFEDRVAKAVVKLGVPSAKDMNALMERIQGLDEAVSKLSKWHAASVKPTSAMKTGASAKSTPRPALKSLTKSKPTPKSAAKPSAKAKPKAVNERSAPRKSV